MTLARLYLEVSHKFLKSFAIKRKVRKTFLQLIDGIPPHIPTDGIY